LSRADVNILQALIDGCREGERQSATKQVLNLTVRDFIVSPAAASSSSSSSSQKQSPIWYTPLQQAFQRVNFEIFSCLLLAPFPPNQVETDSLIPTNPLPTDCAPSLVPPNLNSLFSPAESDDDDKLCPGIAIVKQGIRSRRTFPYKDHSYNWFHDSFGDTCTERFNLSVLRCALASTPSSASPAVTPSTPLSPSETGQHGVMLKALPDTARRLIASAYRLHSSKVTFNRDDKLGAGGFGTVYRGQLIKSRQSKETVSVAVKTFSHAAPQSATTGYRSGNSNQKKKVNSWQEIEEEMLLMLSLTTAGSGGGEKVLRCFGFTQDEYEMNLILELATHGSLKSLLQRVNDWEEERQMESENVSMIPLSLTLRWLRELADTLSYLHNECQIKHKDLKCDNLLVFSTSNKEFFLKICDFGIAKEHITQTASGSTYDQAGTLPYMAFELRNGERSGYAADIFAFAITAVEIFTRRSPKTSDCVSQIETAIQMLFEREGDVMTMLNWS
jgi:hypothetical protein